MRREWRLQLAVGGLFWCLLILTFLIYQPGLGGPLLLDDFSNLEPLGQLQHHPERWREVVASNGSGPLGRPISMLSFVVNWLSSPASTVALKYTNLMLHLLTGVLIFWLGGRLLRGRMERPWLGALWVATLWLTAPLFVSTVLYVIQRMAQLSALFMFAGLLSYVIGRQSVNERPVLGTFLIFSTFLVWTPLAALSKENGLLLPVLALLTEYFVFRFSAQARVRRTLFGLFALTVLVPMVVFGVYILARPEFILGGYEGRGFGFAERLLTEARILIQYAADLIIPQGTKFGIYHDDYQKSTGLFSPPMTVVSIVILAAAVVAAFWIRRKRHLDLLAFGLLFYLGGHVLESSVFPLELYFEHRNYLPGAGLFLALVGAGLFLWQRLPSSRAGILVVALAMPGVLAASTYNRVQVWASEPVLLSYAGTFHPRSTRAHTHIALYYARHGDAETAMQFSDRLERLGAGDEAGSVLLRFILFCTAGATPPESLYKRLAAAGAPEKASGITENLRILTDLVLEGRCPGVDTGRLVAGLEGWLPGNQGEHQDAEEWKLYAFAAKLNGHLARYDQALRHVERAADMAPEVVELSMMKVYYLVKLGAREAAEEALAELQARQERRGQAANVRRIIEYYRGILDSMTNEAQRS